MEKIITKNLLPGRSYRVRATGVDSDGKTITSQVYILKTKGKSDAPPNVTNLSADFKGKTLVVTWNGDSARAEKDFKHFRIRLTSSNHSGVIKNYYTDSNVFKFQEDQNRDAFGEFEGTISITVYSIDRTGNQSSGVSVNVTSEAPVAPTNVKLSAAVLGYNVSWDFPTFPNYKETRVYHSGTQNGTYTLASTAYGSGSFVSLPSLSEKWVKVSHVNLAGVESEKVASVPPNITPIDPVPIDVTPPNEPTNLNWEDAGLDTTNGINTANMRAHWEVSEITSGYKVRVTEDITNKENWAVYDVPASKATVTHKSILSGTATLTVTAHSFATDDYVTVFNLGAPFDGKKKITSVTPTTISFTVVSSDLSQTADPGEVVISSYTVKGLTPGTQYYGAILAYDSANNLTQFVSEGTFTTSGTAGTIGSAITIPGTTMAFGPNAGGTGKTGLHINSSNYWYNTGLFNAGTPGNSISWDGVRLRVDGSIAARGGTFTGNVFLSSQKASVPVTSASLTSNIATLTTSISHGFNPGQEVVITGTPTTYIGTYTILDTPTLTTFTYSKTNSNLPQSSASLAAALVSSDTTSSLIAAEYYNVQSATYSNGVGTIILSENPANWVAGNTIVVSLTSSIFDGQYVITSVSGSTITFKMSPSVGSPSPVTNTGRVANLSVGDRVIFNANGVQALEDSAVIFSINRSRSHKIGGFSIRPARITGGADADSVAIASSGTWRIWAGANEPENAPFRVSGAGNIRAYGLFSSSSVDSGTRVSIGSDVVGTRDGILLDDTTQSGYENFWYIPSTVSAGQAFFQVGTESGSGITVKKVMVGQSAYPKVFIKDYNIQGTNVFEANGILDLGNGIKLGKDIDGAGRDGFRLDADNYWYFNTSDTKFKFKAGTSTKFIEFTGSALNIATDTMTIGGSSAATQSYADQSASNAAVSVNIVQKWNGGQVTGITLDSTGSIRSLNKSYGDSNTGWTLQYDNNVPKFEISKYVSGDTTKTKYLRYSTSGDGELSIMGASLQTSNGTSYAKLFNNGLEFYDSSTLLGSLYANATLVPRNGGPATGYLVLKANRVTIAGPTLGSESYFEADGIYAKWLDLTSQSYIIGIGDKSGAESIDKVLVRITGATNQTKYLRWATIADIGGGGGGTTYTAGNGISISGSVISNTGFRMNGDTTVWNNPRTSSDNRITFGTTLPPTGSGRSDGDIHIEF